AAVGRGVDTGDQVEHRGLAGAVGADESEQRAALEREVEIGDRLETAELHRHLLEREDRAACHGITPPPALAGAETTRAGRSRGCRTDPAGAGSSARSASASRSPCGTPSPGASARAGASS